MNFNRVIAILMMLYIFGCSGKFTAKDRFEGVKDDTLRLYVRFSNESEHDVGSKELKEVMLGRGDERLKMLTAQGIVDKKIAGDAAGSVVYVRCFDEYCEGFIDYKIGTKEKK